MRAGDKVDTLVADLPHQQIQKFTDGDQKSPGGGGSAASSHVQQWKDKKVVSRNGEELGTVKNIYSDQNNQAKYLIVQAPNGKLHPVPTDMVQPPGRPGQAPGPVRSADPRQRSRVPGRTRTRARSSGNRACAATTITPGSSSKQRPLRREDSFFPPLSAPCLHFPSTPSSACSRAPFAHTTKRGGNHFPRPLQSLSYNTGQDPEPPPMVPPEVEDPSLPVSGIGEDSMLPELPPDPMPPRP